jgi:hypothetical protein
MSLVSGDKVRVIGGKWKKHWGFLKTISTAFSQVELHHFTQSKSAGDPEDVVEKKVCRVKNKYLEKFPEMVWEMPEADQLQPVGPEAPLVMPEVKDPVIEEIVEEGGDNAQTEKMIQDVVAGCRAFSVEEALSEHASEGDPVDITADLPSMDEALLLRQKVYDLERACRIKDLIIERLVLP